MKLIDKDKLVTEIEKKLQDLIACVENISFVEHRVERAKIDMCKETLSFLDTLEVKEVDLEKEIALWANAIPEIRLDDVERLAKYFFELGMQQSNNNNNEEKN